MPKTIIIDAMGGDNAPREILCGVRSAIEDTDARFLLVGRQAEVEPLARDLGLGSERVELVHAPSVVDMADDPLTAYNQKKDSSMSVGLRMLVEGRGDAFVSAGNTGALVTGATLLVRRIKGIQRAGIATVLPFPVPLLLMDSGANLTVTSEHLEQFAYMGSKYMEKIYDIKRPRVGLLNNGSEYNKGNQVQVEAYQLMLSQNELNFIGNVEGKELPFNVCDVLVTDGFTGNIVLKYTEGMGKFMLHLLKDVLTANLMIKLSAATMKDQLHRLKKQFDASEHGGAPLLGLSKPVIKAHGSSDAQAICNAVRQAISFVKTGVIGEITDYVENEMPVPAAKGEDQ